MCEIGAMGCSLESKELLSKDMKFYSVVGAYVSIDLHTKTPLVKRPQTYVSGGVSSSPSVRGRCLDL